MGTERFTDDPSFQVLNLNILSEMLRRADNPTSLGEYLCAEIRELTGAGCVLLIQCLCTETESAHRIASINPRHLLGWAESLTDSRFFDIIHNLTGTQTWNATEESEAAGYLRRQDFDLSVAVPLNADAYRFGAMLVLGLPDENHLSMTIDMLTTLSTLTALVLHKAFLLEKQNDVIRERTHELQRANEALRVGQDRLRLATNAAGIAIWDWDIALGTMVWDENMHRIYGIPDKDIACTYEDWLCFVHPDDAAKENEAIQTALRGEEGYGSEFRIVLSDGSIRYIQAASHIFRDKDGAPCRMIGTHIDITERKLAELALQDSEYRYRSTLEAMLEGCQIIGHDWRYLYVNEVAAGHGRRKREELLGGTIMEMYPGIEKTPVFATLQRCMHERVSEYIENEFVYPDNSTGWFELSINPVPEGIFILSVDITKRKQAEEALRISLTKYRILFEAFPLGITVTDKKGNIVEGNRKAEEILGISAEEHKKRKIDSKEWRIIRSDGTPMPVDEYASTIALTENRLVENMEMGVAKGENDISWINVTAAPIPLEDLGVAITYGDISERRRTEEILRVRVRLTERSFFLTLEELLVATLDEVEVLTESPIGFYHFLGADQKTISLQAWSTRTTREFCTAAGKGTHYDLDQAGVWADCIRRRGPIVYNDYQALSDRKGLPPGHAHVSRMLAVPIKRGDKIVAMLGVGNKARPYDEKDVEAVSILADLAWEIAERSRAEEALSESEERFRMTFEQAAVGMAHVDPDGRFLRINQRFCDILGYTNDEMLVLKYQDITHPDDLEAIIDMVRRMLDENIRTCSLEKRYIRKDGDFVWGNLMASLLRDASGTPKYFIVTLEDITERKRAEEEVGRLKNYLGDIIDSMPSVLVGMDGEGKVTQWNRNAEADSGIPAASALGRPYKELLPEFTPWIETLRSEIAQRRPAGLEKLLMKKGGERRFYDLMLYPLIADGMEGSVLRIEDVTEQARIQELMVQTEKMMSLGGLAAGMAHEINNPLGIITQAAQNIERRVSPDLPGNRKAAEESGVSLEGLRIYLEQRQIPEFIASIRMAAARASKIINGMLAFSRRRERTIQMVQFAEIVEQAIDLAANDYDLKKKFDFRSIRIVREYASKMPLVPMATVEIEQVVLNLLKNAAQAMMGNPPERKPEIRLRLRHDEGYAVLEVEDNGPGMEEQIRRRVFEPFFTTKEPGMGIGLGLPVSYMIVTQNHKGLLEVESSPGAGARFTVRLPLGKEGAHV